MSMNTEIVCDFLETHIETFAEFLEDRFEIDGTEAEVIIQEIKDGEPL